MLRGEGRVLRGGTITLEGRAEYSMETGTLRENEELYES